MQLVNVVGITVFPPFQGYGVILREQRDNGRWFPIFIGPAEAQTISLLLRKVKHERPLTYDMFQAIFDASDATIEKVSVVSLKDNTFYAEISLNVLDQTKTIDARPSDAIALALKLSLPIYVADEILLETGFTGEIGEQPITDTEHLPSDQSDPVDPSDSVDTLQKRLEELVAMEYYEEAAKIRDRIKALQTSEGKS